MKKTKKVQKEESVKELKEKIQELENEVASLNTAISTLEEENQSIYDDLQNRIRKEQDERCRSIRNSKPGDCIDY